MTDDNEDGAGLIHQIASPIAESKPRLSFDERAKWFRDGRRSAFTCILGYISESSPDLVRVCPCENPNCSEPVHRNGRVKPVAITEPPRVGWRRWAWVDSGGRLSIMNPNATREEVAELGEPDERLIRVQITEIGSGNQDTSAERAQATGRSEAQDKQTNNSTSLSPPSPPSVDQARVRVLTWLCHPDGIEADVELVDALIAAVRAEPLRREKEEKHD